MRQIHQDLLICGIGSEDVAQKLANRFHAMFPRIRVHSTGMTDALLAMLKYRFRAVIIATVSEVKLATGVMVKKILECEYSANNVFVYRADNTVHGPVQYVVREYGFGDEEKLFAAAKKAAELNTYCRWQTREDIDRAYERAAQRMADLEVRALSSKPVRKPWMFRVINIIGRR